MSQDLIPSKHQFGALDPKIGDNAGTPLSPTRVARWIENDWWFELEPNSLSLLAYGRVGEQHQELR